MKKLCSFLFLTFILCASVNVMAEDDNRAFMFAGEPPRTEPPQKPITIWDGKSVFSLVQDKVNRNADLLKRLEDFDEEDNSVNTQFYLVHAKVEFEASDKLLRFARSALETMHKRIQDYEMQGSTILMNPEELERFNEMADRIHEELYRKTKLRETRDALLKQSYSPNVPPSALQALQKRVEQLEADIEACQARATVTDERLRSFVRSSLIVDREKRLRESQKAILSLLPHLVIQIDGLAENTQKKVTAKRGLRQHVQRLVADLQKVQPQRMPTGQDQPAKSGRGAEPTRRQSGKN
ncbi:MAG: hypothetical protein HY537_13415 [Deltaproteobacteria bacterium]|nr:hypothetical protein [Deltaproteobacteria bacterium]